MKIEGRTGSYQLQPGRYRAFIPRPIPFDPPAQYDDKLLFVLSKADLAIGQLNAAAEMLPNPDLFVAMYVKKESVLSSRVEGVTQASLGEVLEAEARSPRSRVRADVNEVLNHVDATNYGMGRLKELPLSNRLIREIHGRLMTGVRGQEKSPREFRKEQNWIGPAGCDLSTATFVPPPPTAMHQALAELEDYFNDPTPVPPLVKAGLMHYQFETIHPFLDGNGRLGRLLVTFFLCEQNVLKRPLLYISQFIEEHKDAYYQALQDVGDDGDIEAWLTFFLTAVWRVAQAASDTASRILLLREQHRSVIHESSPASIYPLHMLDHLFSVPFITVNSAKEHLKVSYPTASTIIKQLQALQILEEITHQGRNRMYAYRPYLDLLEAGLSAGDSRTSTDRAREAGAAPVSTMS